MKKVFFTLLLSGCLATASAQFSRPVSIGAGAGVSYGLTDLKNTKVNFAWYGEGDYLINPFVSVGLQAQKGELSGTSGDNSYKNSYYAGNVNVKLRIGQFMDLHDNYSYYTLGAGSFQRILSNVYIGAGAGLMKNRIQRDFSSVYTDAVLTRGGEIADDRFGIHFVVPLNVGVDIPFGRTLYGPQWALNINYQHGLTFNDNIDGVINKKNDQYGVITVGVKYALFNRN